MNNELLTMNNEQITILPTIIDETDDFAVVYKPPRMHCAPLKPGGGDTLLDWYAAVFPSVTELSGRKEGEGGLLHRLDFETQGLVLFAKNQGSLDHLLRQQDEGKFVKEYNAHCSLLSAILPPAHCSFVPPPFNVVKNGFPSTPFVIESFFRAYGPGRKQVRPVTDAGYKHRKIGDCYRTEVISVSSADSQYTVTARLCRGFRHQIRCHLAWIGCPVLNDPLYGYGQAAGDGFLALSATGLTFIDIGGKLRKYNHRVTQSFA
jgi:23S rRNA pseudouridine1911/1915/1917 synthase